jgi:hypothetical protein
MSEIRTLASMENPLFSQASMSAAAEASSRAGVCRGDDAEQGMGTTPPSVLDTELLRHRWTYR